MDNSRTMQSPTKSGLPRLSMLPTPQASRTLPSPSKLPALSSSRPTKTSTLTSPVRSTLPSTAGRRVSGIARPSSAQGQNALSPTKHAIGASSATRRISSIGAPPSISPVKASSGRRVSGLVAPSVSGTRSSSAFAHRPLSPTKPLLARTPARPAQKTPSAGTRVRPQSVHIGTINRQNADEASDRLGALTSFSSRTGQYGSPTISSPGSSPLISNAGDRPQMSAGSSLYDRTIESIAQLPSTPSSISDRRRSGLFTAESPTYKSPMGPPARPASSFAMPKRPTSSSNPTARPTARPSSPIKTTPLVSKSATSSTRPLANSRRSLSVNIPQTTRVTGLGISPVRGVATPSQRSAAQIKKPAQPVTARKVSASSSRSVSVRTPSPINHSASSKVSASSRTSSSFRQAIAQVKAAKPSTQKNSLEEYDVDVDPFNHRRRTSDLATLCQRVDAARRDGKLNINGLGLEVLPEEVLRMYEPHKIAESDMTMNETMDLSVLLAGDNSLTLLSDEAFPDVTPEDAYQDDNLKASIFAVVERMSLRGNQLMVLPVGMRHLRRLTSLDLSHNELGNSTFDILPELEALRELHLGNNNIGGFLPQSIGSLTKLEVLDIRNNRVLNVPESIRFMSDLRVLNLSGNQLTGVPMDALECLPIKDLDVSNNALVGALFPFGVSGLQHVEELNISNNSLASLAFSENIALPNIRILKVSNNRIVSFPDMSGWSELITLAAGGNKIDAFPQGFVSLRRLRNADFSNNDITRLDARIASMNCLESLVVSANPLVERKYLTMTADAIKRDLRQRAEPPIQSQRTSSSFEDEAIDVRSPKPSPAQIKFTANGELDLSGQGLIDRDADGLRSLLGMHDIRSLQLSRNRFTIIPYELSLAQNLRSLDLSMCQLGTVYLDEPLTLMSLQHLQLSGNGLASLQPLIDMLRAPYLRFLDISNNRLQGALPILRDVFEHLQELYAADNHIDSVSVEAVRGLGTVVLARNDISQLPPELGLLAFEGLKTIDFSSNAFRVPSHSVLDKGTEATLAWLRGRIPDYAGDDETF